MVTPEAALQACPWHGDSSKAAFAADAVVQLLGGEGESPPFASPGNQALFDALSQFSIPAMQRSRQQDLCGDAQLVAALLHKIAYRGTPAPCSLLVEKHVLDQAQAVGILTYTMRPSDNDVQDDEQRKRVSFDFECVPRRDDLHDMLLACLLPELLLDDAEVSKRLSRYKKLCNATERRALQMIVDAFPDPRLALLLRPQRTFGTMCRDLSGTGVTDASKVDFALEIPSLVGGEVRVVVELDGPQHDEPAQRALDLERDDLLKQNGWRVHRLRTADEGQWSSVINHLCKELVEENSLQPLLDAAARVRGLPANQQKAVTGLMYLPVAEAQIMAVVTQILYLTGPFEQLTVADPEGYGIGSVLEAVNQWIAVLEGLHGISPQGRLTLFDGAGKPDIIFHGPLGQDDWTLPAPGKPISVGYCPAATVRHTALLPAHPRPIQFPESGEDEDRRTAKRTSLDHLLQNIFRKVRFMDGQTQIIERALALRNVIGLLPTGAGKSLCYQLAGFTQPGMVLVVSPLRALMLDQKMSLRAFGIHRSTDIVGGTGSTKAIAAVQRKRLQDAMAAGQFQFVLIAPERLQIPEFKDAVGKFVNGLPIPFCVIDEVHCVSEWGHDFRTSYLNIGRHVEEYCRHAGSPPATLYGLTATASSYVLQDIKRELRVDPEDKDGVVKPSTFNRANLQFEFNDVGDADRTSRKEVISDLMGQILIRNLTANSTTGCEALPSIPSSGLIFHNFVNPRIRNIDCVDVLWQHLKKQEVTQLLPLEPYIDVYASTKPKSHHVADAGWDNERPRIQQKFKEGVSPILVCSHSFGMGIDKANVRFTINSMLPRSVEDFYQQAGRAGRDDEPAVCALVFSDHNSEVLSMLEDDLQIEDVLARFNAVGPNQQDDVTRNLWFFGSSYIGVNPEIELTKWVFKHTVYRRFPKSGSTSEVSMRFDAIPVETIQQCLDIRLRSDTKITREKQEAHLEKALYRLVQTGIIMDYMKDYAQQRFILRMYHPLPEDVRLSLDRYLDRYSDDANQRVDEYRPRRDVGAIKEAADDAIEKVVKFTYDTILKQRRRAQATMLSYARVGTREGGEAFRTLLLGYLGESPFAAPISELATSVAHESVPNILNLVSDAPEQSAQDVVGLIGACDRRLEDEPDNAALLWLAGVGRLANESVIEGNQDLRRGVRQIARRLSTSDRCSLAVRTIQEAGRIAPGSLHHVLNSICEEDSSVEVRRAAARTCLQMSEVNDDVYHAALKWLSWCIMIEVRIRLEYAA